MTEQEIRTALPHLATVTEIGTSGNFKVKTEEGYWIRKPDFPENVWKTVTFIYPDDDLTAIQVVATADLPEGAEQCGDVTEPETETMGDTTDEPEVE